MSGFLNRLSVLTISVLWIPQLGLAAPIPAEKGSSDYNFLLITLITFAVILLVVIAMLGNVLRQLTLAYGQKLREKRNESVISKIILLLLAFGFPAAYAKADEVIPEPTSVPATIYGLATRDFYLISGLIGLEVLIIAGMLISIKIFVGLLSNRPEAAEEAKKRHRKPFFDRVNRAVAVEKEQDIMLDHDYDGIRELDNSLPPWWKYGFYLTILIGVIYLYRYHMGGGGLSSYEEYVAEVNQAEADKAAYLAKSANNIDENTVTMLDASGIAAGQAIFQNVCAACHARDGGGGVGPNLTDNYWLHGGRLQDVFKTIKYGWADKGMKSWKDDFSPKQLAELASYVKSLKGTKPAAPKDKQGTEFIEDEPGQKAGVKAAAIN